MSGDSRRSRRELLRAGLRGAGVLGAGLVAFRLTRAPGSGVRGWQIDPARCIGCQRCATHCVLQQSAVRCYQAFDLCGYCELCSGYLAPGYLEADSAAENQICPAGALRRRFVGDPYFEYTVDRERCVGCGKCVQACATHGNGSLFLQVDQARCRRCNACAIAGVCPADAFVRVPLGRPYLTKGRARWG